jgi:hypothetical protein
MERLVGTRMGAIGSMHLLYKCPGQLDGMTDDVQ